MRSWLRGMGDLRWHRKSNLKKGLGLMSLIGIKGFRSKAFPTCLPVSGSIQDAWNRVGLSEPFGKASLANTAFGSGRLVPMTGRNFRAVEGWLPLSSDLPSPKRLRAGRSMAWWSLGEGFAQALCEEKEKLGESKLFYAIFERVQKCLHCDFK